MRMIVIDTTCITVPDLTISQFACTVTGFEIHRLACCICITFSFAGLLGVTITQYSQVVSHNATHDGLRPPTTSSTREIPPIYVTGILTIFTVSDLTTSQGAHPITWSEINGLALRMGIAGSFALLFGVTIARPTEITASTADGAVHCVCPLAAFLDAGPILPRSMTQ